MCNSKWRHTSFANKDFIGPWLYMNKKTVSVCVAQRLKYKKHSFFDEFLLHNNKLYNDFLLSKLIA